MVNISKFGDSAIKFTFTDNDHYLFNGEIEVPINSLLLVLDESDMVTFKKIDGDPFVSFLIGNSNFASKSDLEDFYIANMVGGGGGGSQSGVTSGEVQTMINTSLEDYYDKDEVDAALSGKADTSAVTQEISAALSGKQDTLIAGSGITISGNVISSEGGNNVIELTQAEYDALADKDPSAFYIITDASEINIDDYYTSAQTQSAITEAISGKADTSAVTQEISAAVSGKMDTNVFDTYSAATDARLAEDEEVTAAAFNDLNEALSGKADTSDVTAALSGKQDTLIAGDNITISGNVISADGGGKTIEAGTNISITTGETADTINCTLNLNNGSGNYSIQGKRGSALGPDSFAFGSNTYARKDRTFAFGANVDVKEINSFGFGFQNNVYAPYSFGFGNENNTKGWYNFAFGEYINTNNKYEIGYGSYNNSVSASTTFGDSGNTLFSVGNGTNNARHNAFEIRQNGDIYLTLDGQDVKLQDQLGGGSITIDPSLDSGSTNAVANSAITNALDSKIQNFWANSNSQSTIRLAIKKNDLSYSDKDLLNLYNGLMTRGASGLTINLSQNQEFNTYSAATNARLAEDEEVTAAGINAVNDKFDGLKLKKLSLAEYNALTVKNNDTLYILVG